MGAGWWLVAVLLTGGFHVRAPCRVSFRLSKLLFSRRSSAACRAEQAAHSCPCLPSTNFCRSSAACWRPTSLSSWWSTTCRVGACCIGWFLRSIDWLVDWSAGTNGGKCIWATEQQRWQTCDRGRARPVGWAPAVLIDAHADVASALRNTRSAVVLTSALQCCPS